MARELRRIGPHAILMYALGIPHLLVGASARLARVPTVQAAAGNPAPLTPAARRKWAIVLWLSALIGVPVQACSRSVERSLRELAGWLPRGSGTVANGCDTEEIGRRAAVARRSRPPDGRLIVGMVARLDPIKDQATLIRAFAALARELPEAELWLVGDGQEEAELRRLADAESVAGRVVFWGRRADIPELLGQMDVYAFSTTQGEGFGIALIEAMAAGLPVVASDVPACREVLADGDAGILVPAGNPVALAAALRPLLRAPGLRAGWAARATARVRAAYTAERCAADWYRLLLA